MCGVEHAASVVRARSGASGGAAKLPSARYAARRTLSPDRTTGGHLCGAPIGLIGFIDATRLWFKARVGWVHPQIPREDSICRNTILQSELVVISDAAMDERFFNGPVVTHAGIRFYAGAPLLTKEGNAVGTLCVIDRYLGNSQPLVNVLCSHWLASCRLNSNYVAARNLQRPTISRAESRVRG